ncbi:MAG TPA: N-acetyl sugar amidotransferase [Sneathiellales bacterium]|nr:N-acetyl sugar amidotransferase [Sneathiellales bacterium]
MRFCSKCVIPDTRPDLDFNEGGECDACRAYEMKHGYRKGLDWEQREKEFVEFIKPFKTGDPMRYDCIIPVSGGKDSTYQTHIALQYGLKPLCICFEPTLPTKIGRQNLDNLNNMGVDLIHFKRNPIIYDRLVMEGFRRVGDPEWINHVGIWTVPVNFAVAFNIPLILWGESPQMEYGGLHRVKEINKRLFDEDWMNDFGCLNGLRAEDMINESNGVSHSDMKMYIYPLREKLDEVVVNNVRGLQGVFLGYYFKWDIPTAVDTIETLGWRRRKGRVETTYTDYEGLDCYSMNIHDYLKYCKFGFGRASDDASRDIRNSRIDREQGVRLAERYDGRYPKHLVEKFCVRFGLSQNEFDDICDSFTNKELFERRDRKFVRDIDGSLVMKSKYFEARRHPS